MSEPRVAMPLFNLGLLCFPGMVVCEHGVQTPVVVFHIIVGEMLHSIVVEVDL